VHEALVNAAFAAVDATALCPYDLATLTAACIEDATRTHPMVTDATGTRSSDRYAPAGVVAGYNLPLPAPPDAFTVAYATPTDLVDLRGLATARALAADLPPARVADLALAITELATNTLRHTSTGGHVDFWTDPAGEAEREPDVARPARTTRKSFFKAADSRCCGGLPPQSRTTAAGSARRAGHGWNAVRLPLRDCRRTAGTPRAAGR
jgi:hypothetical protein